MENSFALTLEDFSVFEDKTYNSRSFAFAGCFWHLLAYHHGGQYLSVYLKLNRESSPPGWIRNVQFRLNLLNIFGVKSNIVSESIVCGFNANNNMGGFKKFVPCCELSYQGGFFLNGSLHFILELHVLPPYAITEPVKPVKVIPPSSSYNEVAFVSKSLEDDSCKLLRRTAHLSNETLDHDGDDDDDDDDDEEEGMDDGDYASEIGSDDESKEDPNDDDCVSYPVSDDGGYRPREGSIYNTQRIKDILDALDSDEAKSSSDDDDDDASQEGTDVDDDDYGDDIVSSYLVMNDNTREESSVDQVNTLEEDTIEKNGDRDRSNTVASVTETFNNALEEIQHTKDTTVDVNGFEVLSYQVESVRRIFEKHPDIAKEFRAKNQHLRNACMNFLLSLIDTLCQSLEELSNEDLVEADIALTYLKDAGFKVDWLEKKLDQLKENKEREQCGLVKLKEIEEHLLILKLKCSEMDDLVEKEKADLLLTRTALSFDDLV